MGTRKSSTEIWQATPEPAPVAMPINSLVFLSKRRYAKYNFYRRILFFSLVLMTTIISVYLLSLSFTSSDTIWLKVAVLVLFGLLNFTLSLYFWTVVFGIFVYLLGGDSKVIPLIKYSSKPPHETPNKPTAIIMTLFNTDPQRVFSGLQAMYQEIKLHNVENEFELFILSDTKDPILQCQEKALWNKMCAHFNAHNKIFYRHREQNIGRKSGNIADFCQRWGGRYDYMIVLDSDSLMSAPLLSSLVSTIIAHPEIGIIQTTALPVNAQTLFGRIMQFSGHLQGKIFSAGAAFWQLSEATYWGHNAIISMKAFTAHAGLPELPGKPPLGGLILSHDTVEAALVREAGWQTWFLYETPGSFEEYPVSMLDYAKRDRRWCQGNIQHAWLLFIKNLSFISCIHFGYGMWIYLVSPVFILFLISFGIALHQSEFNAFIFSQIITLTLLFFPRILIITVILMNPKRVELFGGYLAFLASALLEWIFSILMAPIWMIYHCKFLFSILSGRDIGWPSKNPSDYNFALKKTIAAYGDQTLIGFFILIFIVVYFPQQFIWFLPLILGPLLIIPISVLVDNLRFGQLSKHFKLFSIPEETRPSQLIQIFNQELSKSKSK